MSYQEEQLYYTCMKFCEHFFRYMCKKNEYNNALRLGGDIEEREGRMRFEQRLLQDVFDSLKEAVDKVGVE